MMASRHKFLQPAIACALLILATLAVYWPVTHCQFTNFDDPHYVTENSHVRGGVSWRGIVWAFQTGHAANWHPLTWLSHMLDVQLFGLDAGLHHLVNLLFHIANTLLLFLLFQKLTGATWRSAFVAALFAVHPLHVESVAWVAERKGLLSLWTYAAYVEKREGGKPKAESRKPKEIRSPKSEAQSAKPAVEGGAATHHAPPFTFQVSHFYFLSLLLFAFSLMSKPMLVTLPFLMLLLDYWPLRRFELKTQHSTLKTLLPLFREKLPFLAFSAASSVVTFLVQRHGGTVLSLEVIPVGARIANALVSCPRYIGQFLWPSHLAVLYPHPGTWPVTEVALAGVLLGAFSAVALLGARRRPYVAVGWFWFLGTLVPVIGLVQVGQQAMADRYTYLPSVGLFLLVAWLPPDLLRNWRHHRLASRTAGVAAVVLCLVPTRIQVGYWKNGETLFRHALAVTTNNHVAHHELGVELAERGRPEEARAEFASALKIRPNYSPALSDMAKLLYGEGQFAAAATLLQQVLASHPNNALAHSNLAIALAHQGKTEEALPHYRRAIQLKPDSPEALNNLAWFLATHPGADIRDGAQAVSLAERACGLTDRTNLWLLSTLAAAYAEAGRFAEAVYTQQKVCELAAAKGQSGPAESFKNRLELYRSGQPYRVPPVNP